MEILKLNEYIYFPSLNSYAPRSYNYDITIALMWKLFFFSFQAITILCAIRRVCFNRHEIINYLYNHTTIYIYIIT